MKDVFIIIYSHPFATFFFLIAIASIFGNFSIIKIEKKD
jgi:hypothetical protein